MSFPPIELKWRAARIYHNLCALAYKLVFCGKTSVATCDYLRSSDMTGRRRNNAIHTTYAHETKVGSTLIISHIKLHLFAIASCLFTQRDVNVEISTSDTKHIDINGVKSTSIKITDFVASKNRKSNKP